VPTDQNPELKNKPFFGLKKSNSLANFMEELES